MARFFASAVFLAAALLMAARLTNAEPSTAEVFLRSVLPGSAVPDAVLQLLRPATTTSPTKRPASHGVPASGGARDVDKKDDPPVPFSGYKFSGYDDVRSTTRGGGGVPATSATTTKRPAAIQGVPASGGATDVDKKDDPPVPFSGYKFSGYDDVRSTTSGGGGVVPTTSATTTKLPAAIQGVLDSSAGGGDVDPFPGYKFSNYVAPSKRYHRAAKTAVFFHEEAVRVGERLPIHFRAGAAAELGLLPRGVADSIPFTTAALPAVLALLGVPPGSSMATAMAETLRTCERPPPAGDTEAMFCATSLESLVERAVAALGTRDVRAVTSALPRAGLPPQAYAVRAVRRVVSGGASFVACHDEAYPYTVYFCHGTGPARAYLLEMEGTRGGAAVTVAFVCHTDTSRWNPEHVSFKVLGIKPGGKPVCHLMPYGHIIWVKNVKPSPA